MADFPIALTNAIDGVPGVGTEILAKNLNNLEAKVGIDASAVTSSLDYLLKNAASIEPGHKHYQLWKPDGLSQAVVVESTRRVRVDAPAANTSALLVGDGLGTLNYTTIGGYYALLILNVVDGANSYQLFYVNEDSTYGGKVANYINGGLEFDHYDLSENILGSNVLLNYGGLLMNGSSFSDRGAIYGLGNNQIAIGQVYNDNDPSSNVTKFLINTSTGLVGIGTTSPTISDGVGLHIAGKILRLATAKTPATAGATGNAGEICWDSGALYVCVSTNSWKKVAIAAW